ncbi:glucose 1-dehydrogenase [Candidatus Solincola tengchongensis]|uniref:SDR family NAD(P)-dependent oxidoreductase n=1 Tax=Candidatus Solincola tengchongensis TaxID=2900693 RepID=UPI00257C65C2|nr:glucose 1-dehydrogenase [Candidatus Solincola tengchongensis]
MYREKFSLQDKVAIITGGSRGIGKAIAEGFAEMGAKVVLASRKAEALEEVRRGIQERGGEAHVIPTHMGDLEGIERLVQGTLDRYGTIDILVNNAATNPVFCSTAEIEEAAWNKIMDVNVKGVFFLTQKVGKVLCDKGSGSVINISSEAGFCPTPFLGVYSISKAAVNMLTKVFAQEWGPKGVRVNAIAPGLVRTHFSQALWGNEAILQTALASIPLGRIAEPEEIVGLAIYLASEASSYVTGQVFLVDGGREVFA